MSVIDSYLAQVDEPQKSELQRIRRIIQSAANDVEEVISYDMPAFKYKGKYLIGFAPFKDHMSIFPGSEAIADLQEQLSDFTIAKGTIQFTNDHPLSESLLEAIVQHGVKRINSQ